MLPFWWILRYNDLINNPSSTAPTNLTMLEKIAMLEKSNQIIIDELTEIKKKIEEMEKNG